MSRGLGDVYKRQLNDTSIAQNHKLPLLKSIGISDNEIYEVTQQ